MKHFLFAGIRAVQKPMARVENTIIVIDQLSNILTGFLCSIGDKCYSMRTNSSTAHV